MAVKKTVAKVAKEEVNATPVVETKEEVKETAKKAVAKKAPAKKETAEKAEKAPAKKATKKDVKIAIQFADKSYTTEDLANIANDVWVYDYNKKASELKDVQLYVKPEEAKVYYVFNDEITGDFNI